ncbi:hypothetical protein [Limisalsivibrio acetivorans]|uniref:hypothetical protein n=1 Tax=Limisalsivibrio acetivorans TaxID=1304888 RepID=UPI0003B6DF52|nr:hypothetical protein [Limisalsivibrio acetivorans]
MTFEIYNDNENGLRTLDIPDTGVWRLNLWRVPFSISADGYFVSLKKTTEPQEVPPCRGVNAEIVFNGKIYDGNLVVLEDKRKD